MPANPASKNVRWSARAAVISARSSSSVCLGRSCPTSSDSLLGGRVSLIQRAPGPELLDRLDVVLAHQATSSV